MRIKRVEIIGFKSFVEKTTISFFDPVTAIVGPNGCGKSNVVDAIRWVMGEQSAKHLRGRAMEDVIFAGSETRGPAGFAEVSLTFDGSALDPSATAGGVAWGAVGPAEIVVTRRLFRDGQSDYLLNGVSCRLRDVVDFFLGTGVGSKAYAIIEQGRIGFIVSSRPEERRGLIDEAAGITKYKAKKKAAERRMESTRQHLLRVSDVIGEIEGRLRSLRLQAAKAERYKRYKAELRDLDLWSAAQRFLGHLADEKSVAAELDELRGKHEDSLRALEIEEAAVETERLAVTEEMNELGSAKDALFALSNKAQLDLQRALHHQDEADAAAARAAAGRREIEDLTSRLAAHAAAIEELDGQLLRLDEEAETSGAGYQEKQAAHAQLRAGLDETRRRLDGAAAEMSLAKARIARNESEQGAALARREDLGRRLESFAAEDDSAAERLAALAVDGGELKERLAEIGARRLELGTRKKELEARLVSLRADVSRGEMELETLREEAHRRRSRLGSLSEIQDRYESFQKGVRAIMQNRRDREGQGQTSGIRAVVADIVQPPPELETAVEAVLGERLGNIIVESHEVGVEAIQFLKSRSEGRSSFIPLGLRVPMATAPVGAVVYDAGGGVSLDGGPRAVFVPDDLLFSSAPGPSDPSDPSDTARDIPSSGWPTGQGVRGPLLDLIGYDRQYDRVANFLLGDVLVVEDLGRALELWRQTGIGAASGKGTGRAKTMVTLDGEVVDPHGVVTGGSRESSAGVLEQKREIRELEQIVAKLEIDYQDALARHVASKQDLADVSRSIEELASVLRTDEVAAVSQQKDLDRAVDEERRLSERRRRLETDSIDLRRSLVDCETRADNAAMALEADAAMVEADAQRVDELRAEATALAAQVDVVIGELTALKVAAAQAQDRRNHARSTRARLAAENNDSQARIERLEKIIGEEAERSESLRVDSVRLRDEAALAQAEAEARARVHAERQEAIEERHALLTQREAELRATRAGAARMGQTMSRLELRRQEAAMKRAALEEQVSARYADVDLIECVSDYHLRPPVTDQEEKRMVELRGLIERMGEINLTAIEESEESQNRFDFLTTQRADLESALAQLESAVEKINRASRKRFRETFDAIDLKFREVYPRMFGGGRAHLSLTDEGDLLETGVDIVANPPGKKVMQNIELLSGGEKALTAVSLLFAIFLVKPSPFCVLDEVDAPLDEANVGRFNEMVRAMTDRSQFIIISHNRRTMEIADRLCGITMEEPGVSKLVAVNLRSGSSGKVARASVLTESSAA